jgi:hypothetical protein
MRKKFWDKRIPTLFGILLITLGVGITTFLVNQGVLFKSNASLTQQPQNVRITNITDSSFSISYSTQDQVIGSLNYGADAKLGNPALDDRNQQTGTLTPYRIHNITVRNLTPETKYYFSITSGQENYLNGDKPFEVITGPKISGSPPSQNPMSGKIMLNDGSVPKETIIYVTADGSQVISVPVKTDGTYILPLNSIRTLDLSAYYNFSTNSNLKMLILGDSLTSNVTLSINQINSIPTIILSKDYDFRESQMPTATASGVLESFPSFSSTSSAVQTPEILTPENNQKFTDQQPLFKGKALPNQNVVITIQSDQTIQTTVQSDANGNWNYRPSSTLSPGNHTITISSKDSNGILKTITQSFIVYASGEQVLPAVPSVTPTPTIVVNPTTPVVPTATPTISMTQTQVSTTAAITSLQTPTVIPSKSLPPTGNPSIMTAGIIGATVSIVGGLLFLLAL